MRNRDQELLGAIYEGYPEHPARVGLLITFEHGGNWIPEPYRGLFRPADECNSPRLVGAQEGGCIDCSGFWVWASRWVKDLCDHGRIIDAGNDPYGSAAGPAGLRSGPNSRLQRSGLRPTARFGPITAA